jgi:hypothetical protein
MIDRGSQLSVKRQAQLLDLSRSTVYDRVAPDVGAGSSVDAPDRRRSAPQIRLFRAQLLYQWQGRVEAARTALRSLVGTIPVFAEGGKLYGRIGFNSAQLLRTSNPGLIASCGSGGLHPTNGTVVVPFPGIDLRRRSAPAAIPSHCGNGHALIGRNISTSGGRWRCRACGAERALRFRMPQIG